MPDQVHRRAIIEQARETVEQLADFKVERRHDPITDSLERHDDKRAQEWTAWIEAHVERQIAPLRKALERSEQQRRKQDNARRAHERARSEAIGIAIAEVRRSLAKGDAGLLREIEELRREIERLRRGERGERSERPPLETLIP